MASVVCSSCGYQYSIDFRSADIMKSTLNVDDMIVNVLWFYCPRCGEFKIVNAEDEHIKALRDDYERCKARFRKYVKLENQELIINAQKTMNHKHDKLSSAIDKVIAELYVKFTIATDGTNAWLVPKPC